MLEICKTVANLQVGTSITNDDYVELTQCFLFGPCKASDAEEGLGHPQGRPGEWKWGVWEP